MSSFSPPVNLNLVLGDPRLNSTDKLVLALVDRTVRAGHDLLAATATLARKVGRSARTVQLALAKAVRLGLLRRVRDYTLRTRRRYVLLYRGAGGTPPTLNFFGATDCAQSAQGIAPSPATPPDPPSIGPEGLPAGGLSDDDSDPPVSPPPPAPAGPVETSSSSGAGSPGSGPEPEPPAPPRPATADERRAVAAKAERCFGAGLFTRTKALALAKVWRLSWVDAALDACLAAKGRDGRVGWGYLVGTLRTFRAEGGPPPPRPASRFDRMSEAEAEAELRRLWAEQFGVTL